MNISGWSTAAASNNASVPDGFPEGMAPSGVNDAARELMGAVRRWYEDAEWINLGGTPTYVSTSTFTLVGDKRTQFHVGRRVKLYDASTLYGTIHSSTYTGAASTGVYVNLDSGNLSASLTSVAVGSISFNNTSQPDLTATAANSVTDGTNIIKTKIINIGDWDMDATANVSVAHGLNVIKIRTVSASIINDAASLYGDMDYNTTAFISDPGAWIGITWDATNVNLYRGASSFYDSTDYNSTSYNRGWITITYVV